MLYVAVLGRALSGGRALEVIVNEVVLLQGRPVRKGPVRGGVGSEHHHKRADVGAGADGACSWDNYNRKAEFELAFTLRTGKDSGDCIFFGRV